MNSRDTILRAIRFERPEFIPLQFHVSEACWARYDREALQDLMEAHPLLFPDFKRKAETVIPNYGPRARKGEVYTDPWGCVWECAENGMTGAVSGHPLADWSSLLTSPSPGLDGPPL
jgi:uroporphyrinogen decarboxylase